VRYRFLKEHQGECHPIEKACKILRISKSEFYEYLGRRKSNQQIEREALEGFVSDIFAEHKARYGSRRIKREPAAQGIRVSEKRVRKVMQKLDLVAKGTTRRYRRQKRIEPGDPRLNLVEQVFTVRELNRLWVDITYIPTQRGFLYLATVIDAFSRKVVGWSMSANMRENLVIHALEQAIGRGQPLDSSSMTIRARSIRRGPFKRHWLPMESSSWYLVQGIRMTMRLQNPFSKP